MRSIRLFPILCMIVLLVTAAYAQGVEESPTPQATEEATPSGQTYVVQPGDNLFRIARRFGVTTSELAQASGITNTSQIFPGQQLVIPGAGPTIQPTAPQPTAQPTEPSPEPTTEPTTGSTGTYTVQRGDTLNSIARNLDVNMNALAQANNIINPNLIFVGQVLTVPVTSQAAEPETPDDEEAAPLGETDTQGATLDPGFSYGIEVFIENQDVPSLTSQLEQLGMPWVKVRADWSDLEPESGQIDFSDLDAAIDSFEAAGFNILLTVTNAPAWARTSPDENGPPDDLADFASFMTAIANQYAGQVGAYEIWDEPNLRRNWNCERRMCDTDYVEMVRLAHDAIKAADPNALVVTAGLAPTRFNDRINAIHDQLFLETIYANGIAEVSDAIGAHPSGWANPPDAVCCSPTEGVETHFESDSFYFLDNVRAYRDIMTNAGDANTPLWLTKFGWGTSEDTNPPSELHEFVTYTSLAEQAIYIPRAFELGQELGYVGPMFLDNLNGCQGVPDRTEACFNALIAPDGTLRIAFSAVETMEKATPSAQSAETEAPGPIETKPVGSALPEVEITEEPTSSP